VKPAIDPLLWQARLASVVTDTQAIVEEATLQARNQGALLVGRMNLIVVKNEHQMSIF